MVTTYCGKNIVTTIIFRQNIVAQINVGQSGLPALPFAVGRNGAIIVNQPTLNYSDWEYFKNTNIYPAQMKALLLAVQ